MPPGKWFLDGQSRKLGEEELAACLQESGVEHKAEQQVLASFRLPRVAALAFACRLVVGADDGIFRHVSLVAQVGEVAVGGVGFV